MRPASEGFCANDAMGHGMVQRLVGQAELVLRHERLAQGLLDGAALLHAGIHVLAEEHEAPPPGGLGVIEGDVGLAGELDRLGGDQGRERDADADADIDLRVAEIEAL